MTVSRALLAGAALAGLAFVWGGGADWLVGHGFAAHMLRHSLIVTGIALAIAAALPAGWRRAVPPALAGAVIEFIAVWGWHLPALHRLAASHPAWFAAEQASFLIAGLLVWAGALHAAHPLIGAGALLLTSMHMTLLGALMVLSRADIYGGLHGTLADQQLGGLIMLGIGTPVYLIGGLWLTGLALTERNAAEPS
ncbi:cytochrome c oxidase assembly protein [Profundibacterium mesophilum]|uniref:Cytochrome c oxidase caa3 assembly factor domain containing protein n=1 Tax=Profundibacterium mesophilum KAUST100406-0324 TaxID=1037889 RepID=A0A921NUK7_9RHOB|nr:cytochrome c oxidase assembly protein [Profundibacterium mesophilum]KAF0675843.1 Cytochrome c oxidase caa3 assembly factor domain containing protein [Profundibacterium mesophilum KAUST100406-0324]